MSGLRMTKPRVPLTYGDAKQQIPECSYCWDQGRDCRDWRAWLLQTLKADREISDPSVLSHFAKRTVDSRAS